MPDSFREISVMRVAAGVHSPALDAAAAEEPMEVRVNGEPFAVVMRTPGQDLELAAGFLFAERLLTGSGHLLAIERCRDVTVENQGNVVNARVAGEEIAARMAERRRVVMNASCGLCGRATLESIRAEGDPIDARWAVSATLIASLPERLRAAQSGFDATGGLHAAGLFDLAGQIVGFAEDIGRHNAVDKVVGQRLLADSLPVRDAILVVSGRTSFEILQKAFFAGIPMVCAVSAPSTLAIDLADQAGITLCGFVRGEAFTIYSHPHRVTGQASRLP
jgi:FdhD protein